MPRIDPLSGSPGILALLPDDELETPPLPREHPKWVKDALAISQRARHLLSRVAPLLVNVLTFWDHRRHSIVIAGRALTIDVSGSYRVD